MSEKTAEKPPRIPWWDRFANQNVGKYILPLKICWRIDETAEINDTKPKERREGEPDKNEQFKLQAEWKAEQDAYERQQIEEIQKMEDADACNEEFSDDDLPSFNLKNSNNNNKITDEVLDDY
jgi:hypothetical protein